MILAVSQDRTNRTIEYKVSLEILLIEKFKMSANFHMTEQIYVDAQQV
jgi:hypothetical protein